VQIEGQESKLEIIKNENVDMSQQLDNVSHISLHSEKNQTGSFKDK